MSKEAGGFLIFRYRDGGYEVLLTHPGGPFWAKKDDWSIPKGELDEDEDHLAAAYREFEEETSWQAPKEGLIELGSAPASNGKVNFIWAAEGDFDTRTFACESMVVMEWPRGSGTEITFPENDRAAWFGLATARDKLFKNQQVFIDRLAEHLGVDIVETPKSEQQSLL